MTKPADSLPAATTQGGETLPAKVTLYPQERTLNIPAAPLAVGVTSGCPVTAAAPVEEGREGETEPKCAECDHTEREHGGLSGCWHGSVSAPCLCRKFVPAASRAPHEGPTSGMREIRDELASMLVPRGPRKTPYLKGLHGVDIVQRAVATIDAALAASPLAPTSDGALREGEGLGYGITFTVGGGALLVDLDDEEAPIARFTSPEEARRFAKFLGYLAASRPVVENTGETR